MRTKDEIEVRIKEFEDNTRSLTDWINNSEMKEHEKRSIIANSTSYNRSQIALLKWVLNEDKNARPKKGEIKP